MAIETVRVDAQGLAQLAAERPHTLIFYVATMAFVALTLIPHGSRGDLSRQRKIYWGGTFSAAICAFIAALPNISTGLIVAGLCVFCLALPAYFGTQLIKIGDRVVAFESAAALPATADGRDPYTPRVSASKVWWLAVFGVVIGAVNVLGYVIGGDPVAYGLLGLFFFTVPPAVTGLGDGRYRQRVARGQYLQFGIITMLSAGIFTVCYLVAHSVGLRMRQPSR
ncbi:hypothetical protein MCHIJ_03880 [Mycolicibacterium chitae]|uniref:Transmembrane protein n=1 Tax=Mycolicibacterium chitae TaxID=1792 RepID=A0A3S5EIN3_MYCCI|nr:hypothetical protein [Mycolicibacterium chitae]MCV7109267.1 hypothetical protein [Mycolicibacterium chitae]BBZ00951.1 hypothetical protein MCHIJ_03880 [Mycolicibacterium chitae]VEG49798.1 Uncharacterised protein [Mycolicibacterium chitae]